jgi:hypothetical protein
MHEKEVEYQLDGEELAARRQNPSLLSPKPVIESMTSTSVFVA